MDSMDESTMDSTTDRYVVLIGSGVWIPAELNHLIPFWGLYCCFTAFFLFFFSPSEKSCPLWLGSKQVSLKALLNTIHKCFYIPRSLIIRLQYTTIDTVNTSNPDQKRSFPLEWCWLEHFLPHQSNCCFGSAC